MKTVNKTTILKWVGLTALTFLLPACASLGKAKDFSPHAPMGLVTVISNYDINWVGEKTIKTGGDLTDFVREKLGIQRDSATARISNAETLINEADSLLRKAISTAELFRLADKDQLVRAETYAWGGSGRKPKMTGMITAEDYKPLSHRDKEFAAKLAEETGIHSLLYVTFTFNKEMFSGVGKNGKCRAKVILSAVLINPAGKIIYRKDIETYSQERIAVTNGAYVEGELMELFQEAAAQACARFVYDFTGTP
jgi:hypothetical protein